MDRLGAVGGDNLGSAACRIRGRQLDVARALATFIPVQLIYINTATRLISATCNGISRDLAIKICRVCIRGSLKPSYVKAVSACERNTSYVCILLTCIIARARAATVDAHANRPSRRSRCIQQRFHA